MVWACGDWRSYWMWRDINAFYEAYLKEDSSKVNLILSIINERYLLFPEHYYIGLSSL
jgi:hypothetical protein